MLSIPILTYHKISYQKEFGLTTINPDIFKVQLEILKNQQYRSKIFKDFDENSTRAEFNFILTFDDGYESVYRYAFPLMQEFNFKGVVFIITDYIGKKNDWESYPVLRKFTHLSKEQIIELHRAGFEIGSHGRRHLFLSNKPDRILKTEIEDSKKFIEDLTGSVVRSFCYPFGRYNRRVVEFVRAAGYKYALGRAYMIRNAIKDQWHLSRRTIYSLDGIRSFLIKVSATNSSAGSFITEWIIQQGALINILRQNLNKYD
jgi:peptidoglycan/xylan/chitin deacetylase (PgdA/CDA1 family)